MPSVFAGNQTHNGSFRADQLKLSFGGRSARGLLIQNINFTFGQAVSMLYEIGSDFVYYVGGRSQGTAAVGHIVGPSRFGQALIEKFRDLCFPHDIGFDASAGCGLTASGQPFRGGTKYILQDAVLTNLGVTVTAEQVVINKVLNFMYIDLEYQGGTGPTGLDAAVPGDIIQGGVVAPPVDTNVSDIIPALGEGAVGTDPNPDDTLDTSDLGGIPTLDDLAAGSQLSIGDQLTLDAVLSNVP